MNQEGMFDNRAISSAIRDEIQRFESVHPSIYIIYDLIEEIEDPGVQQQFRDNITGIEDSFVNSQEWTISRRVPEIRLGVLGTCNSGKTSIVHRYLTGMYMPEESPEGGRYKKEVILQGQSNLLLVRDEGGPPEQQFAYWVDAVIFVFSLENEISFNTIYSYYAKMRHYCDMEDVPIILVGSQDLISETSPRVICESRIRRLTADLKDCQYFEVCATYGFNVERIFEAACMQVLTKRTVDLVGPYSSRRALTTSKSFLSRQSQCSSGRGCDSANHAPRPASASSNHIPQGHSPPFREPTPSSDIEFYPLPPQRPERRNRPPEPNKDREKNVLQMEEEQRIKLLSVTAEIARMSAPASSQSAQNFHSQQGHELVDTRDFSSPFSTPNLARKKISSSVQKSSSFSNSGLLRHGSQLSLQIDMRELPSARASSGLKEKFTKRIGDRIDSFFKEFQVAKDKDKASLTPLLSRIPRHRSYSIQGRKDDDKKVKTEEPKGVGRDIPIKQGYLQKRSNKPLSKDWQKKYVTLLDDGRLTYHPNLHDYMNNSHGKEIKLIRTTVKIPGQRPKGSEPSQMLSKQANGTAIKLPPDHRLSGNCIDQNVDAVVIQNSGLKHEIDTLSLSSSIPMNNNNSTAISLKAETPNFKKKQHRRMKSSSKNIDANSLDGDVGGYEFVIVSLDNKQWHFEASSPEEREEWVEAIQRQIMSSLQLNPNTKTNATFLGNKAVAQKIRSVEGNATCADCGAANPDWASLNLGALICIECSGSHRNLGTHLSRVRSLELDEWPEEFVDVMTSIGNTIANHIWEGNISQQTKPSPTSSREEKERWIRRKYEKKEFLPSLPRQDFPTHLQLIDAIARKDIFVTILTLAYASPDQVGEPHSRDARTALHIAAAVGSSVLIQLLLWYGANPDQLDQEGHNAAHYASVANFPNCARLLQQPRHSNASTLPRI